ncbi:MAG TPA: carboxypeptidase-like regulatory domain-containing protein [Bryobacteraceae bacterium]|jgi:hypothetical protein
MRQVDAQFSAGTRKRHLAILFLLLLPGFASLPSAAQVATTGVINGTVSDPSGSAIDGARVTITNSNTGAATETVTNSLGSFTQVGLTPGQYQISISHPGFSTMKETGISLESVAVYTVKAVLKVGAESAAVTVSASAAAVQTSTPRSRAPSPRKRSRPCPSMAVTIRAWDR